MRRGCSAAHLTLPQMISPDPGAAVTFQVLVSWCCVLLTDFTWLTCCLHACRGGAPLASNPECLLL